MEEQNDIEEMNQTQQPQWLVNNILFCYKGDKHTGNQSERKQHFLQHKGKHCSSKEVGYASVFTDTTRRKALPEEAYIHTAAMTATKTARKEIKEREDIK